MLKILKFLGPFLVLLAILVYLPMLILSWINAKIREHVLGIKEIDYEAEEDVLFESKKFKLIREFYDLYGGSVIDEAIDDFIWKEELEYPDQFQIFKLRDAGRVTELQNTYIMGFTADVGKWLLLQKVEVSNNTLETFLISFSKSDGRVDVLAPIGHFILNDFRKKENKIVGFNNTHTIEIGLKV